MLNQKEDSIPYHSVRAGEDDADTDIMGDNSEEAIDEPDCRDSGQKDKPEVEEDVDLFIDDVQGENAESVMFLNGPRRTILVENTFGNLRKGK